MRDRIDSGMRGWKKRKRGGRAGGKGERIWGGKQKAHTNER